MTVSNSRDFYRTLTFVANGEKKWCPAGISGKLYNIFNFMKHLIVWNWKL